MGASLEYHKAWRQRRRDQGICQLCRNTCKVKKDGTFALYCQSCADRQVEKKRRHYVKIGHSTKRPRSNGMRPGQTWCLRCEKHFESPDVPNVRICDRCRPWYQSVDVPDEWAYAP